LHKEYDLANDHRFRWAACQLDVLRKCVNPKKLKEALHNLPPTLDETYCRILCAIDDDFQEYAIRILRWLAFSTRPLRLAEVAGVMAVNPDSDPAFNRDEVLKDPLDVGSIYSSLITVTSGDEQSQGPLVLLAHYSVKEYLVSTRIQRSRAALYGLNERMCHEWIARCCLKYLLQFTKPNTLTRQNRDQFAIATYSAAEWMKHMKEASDSENMILEAILALLDEESKPYIIWIRCMMLINHISWKTRGGYKKVLLHLYTTRVA